MNFYQHQESARSRSAFLYTLFGISVAGLVVCFYLITMLVFRAWRPYEYPTLWDASLFWQVGGVIVASVVLGMVLKRAELSQGGAAVAELVGGRPVAPNTTDPTERRFLNVVAEMSIAAGVPVPKVYVLSEEDGINAFAAGFTPGDAAIAVTKGALRSFDRDELQAVVAHEFAHILNGDMRINVRLISVIAGIRVLGETGEAIVARVLRSSGRRGYLHSNRDGAGAFVVLIPAFALWGLGYLGVFFARLIQLAASRQREYLADAAAVQFTRNGSAMASALKKIGGFQHRSTINSPGAQQMSHLFFSPIESFSALFATHPPLEERIRRIEPDFNGQISEFVPSDTGVDGASFASMHSGDFGRPQSGSPGFKSSSESDSSGSLMQPEALRIAAHLIGQIPQSLLDARNEPVDAIAVVYCLFLDRRPEIRTRQANELAKVAHRAIRQSMQRHFDVVQSLAPPLRLPLAELLFSSLRILSPAQMEQFSREIGLLQAADSHIEVFDYALQRCIRVWMMEASGITRSRSVQFAAFNAVANDFIVVLGAVAWAGTDDELAAGEAFARGRIAFRSDDVSRFKLPAKGAGSFAQLDVAIDRLAASSPFLRRSLIEGVAAVVMADKQLTHAEADLVRVVSLALASPIPDSLHSALNGTPFSATH
jgi:Zn-dependent protease with chaperone function